MINFKAKKAAAALAAALLIAVQPAGAQAGITLPAAAPAVIVTSAPDTTTAAVTAAAAAPAATASPAAASSAPTTITPAAGATGSASATAIAAAASPAVAASSATAASPAAAASANTTIIPAAASSGDVESMDPEPAPSNMDQNDTGAGYAEDMETEPVTAADGSCLLDEGTDLPAHVDQGGPSVTVALQAAQAVAAPGASAVAACRQRRKPVLLSAGTDGCANELAAAATPTTATPAVRSARVRAKTIIVLENDEVAQAKAAAVLVAAGEFFGIRVVGIMLIYYARPLQIQRVFSLCRKSRGGRQEEGCEDSVGWTDRAGSAYR